MPGVLIKSRQEQDGLFGALLDASIMHVDGTAARVNWDDNSVVVCNSGTATMYFARENRGHARIRSGKDSAGVEIIFVK